MSAVVRASSESPGPAGATLREIGERIAALTAGHRQTRWVDGMGVFSSSTPTRPLGTISHPAVSLVAQGAKRSILADRTFEYRAGDYLVVALDLPLTSQVVSASPEEPFQAFSMPLDAAVIAQLLIETRHSPVPDGMPLAVSPAAPEVLDPVLRLLRLLDSPADRHVLEDSVRREIHWRLLTGPQGGLVRQIGMADGRIALVARAIGWIKAHFDLPMRVQDLADEVHVSVATLNRHFRAATTLSPLQYQKRLRLQHARARLLSGAGSAASVAREVGYDSASQFSREYGRLFGEPPGRDVDRLRSSPVSVDDAMPAPRPAR
ncbi:AraC family transcriptional regulator [Phycicoccus sp. CSK15P-2]|uniref:AraC family transcriptional regulator n=1 Tax=Phycicoccus sp. CSK15P-2 TaxID=2807627 RepID=UPI00194FD039|nr:AraC family transcriptional regulator [Phycicoccus sp. CSK15P-2]MBM6403290.1 AraC family transcriptional regulator [Phycicoccus sp. CSK15P-2]